MKPKEEHLKRTIGLFGLSANIINIVIGAGIFALPAIVASNMGSASILAYLFCALLIALIMLCFAEAGSKVTNTGGAYTYIETAFGDYAGFLSGVFSIASTLFADAAVSNALVNLVADVFPIFENPLMRLLFLLILFFGLIYTNVIGVKQGMGLVKFNTLAKLIPLLILVTLGWHAVTLEHLSIEALPDFKTLGQTSLVLFFAFLGSETGLIVGGEVINPKRNIPKAIFISISFVALLYILIQTVCQGILGDDLPNFESAPLAETAKIAFGAFGFVLLIAGAAISMFGNMSGSILNSPRVVYALARDKVIPIKALAKIHPNFATPFISIIIYGGVGFVIAATGTFEQLVIITSSSTLLIYLGVVLSVIRLRKTQKSKEGEFKIPGGLLVPIASIGIILYFLSYLTVNEMLGTAIFAAVISLVFMINKSLQKRRLK
ncbi:APC family permease [Sediminibacter sp. Hel_I_10]|uniref:APC family permease n=1 Tax=Sediminibacter sp. Hel_I_10 TaxID=1392490 RepID=UPI00047C6BA3|nr:APC family permease [Sediminibacter sp. Hel_I_10]